jgi:hypothetical protein
MRGDPGDAVDDVEVIVEGDEGCVAGSEWT